MNATVIGAVAAGALAIVWITRCVLTGDVTVPGEDIGVSVEASVPFGEPIMQLADRLRGEIAARLEKHTRLVVTGIDITIRDISTWTKAE